MKACRNLFGGSPPFPGSLASTSAPVAIFPAEAERRIRAFLDKFADVLRVRPWDGEWPKDVQRLDRAAPPRSTAKKTKREEPRTALRPARKTRSSKQQVLYVMKAYRDTARRSVKIGVTTDLSRRQKKLKAGKILRIFHFAEPRAPFAAEQFLHGLCNPYRDMSRFAGDGHNECYSFRALKITDRALARFGEEFGLISSTHMFEWKQNGVEAAAPHAPSSSKDDVDA